MTSTHGNASSRKISRPGFATLGSSNVPIFRIITSGRVPDSSAIDEPHSGQKCLRIGLPLPPMLLNVLSSPSIVSASLVTRTNVAKALPVMSFADTSCPPHGQEQACSQRPGGRSGLNIVAPAPKLYYCAVKNTLEILNKSVEWSISGAVKTALMPASRTAAATNLSSWSVVFVLGSDQPVSSTCQDVSDIGMPPQAACTLV